MSNEGKLGLAAKAGRWCAGRGCILVTAKGVVGGGNFGLVGRETLSGFAIELLVLIDREKDRMHTRENGSLKI